MIDIKNLEDLRRQAFVTAIYRKIEKDNIVGVSTDKYESLLRGYGFLPFPIIGTDSYIFEYFKEVNLCDPLESTLTYLKTDKCPLLFASKFFIVDDYCKKFNDKLKKATNKDVVETCDLKAYLDINYKDKFDKYIYESTFLKIKKINSLFDSLEQKDIKGSLLFKLKFYLSFVENLDQRISFLEEILPNYKDLKEKRKLIRATCPFAVSDLIESKLKADFPYKIEKSNKPLYTYKNCIYQGIEHITYKELENG
ncbi:MAG: hypothetical protein PUG67_01065 [Peptoniphilaceae bacterium]|nr:hypothetical protein [Peptoniphilaceae bacterium]MDY6018605.1 hypothetical protein [Anaerococcus sp.]